MSAPVPLRIATQEEITSAKGSWLYQRGASLLESYCAKWTQVNERGDLIKDTASLTQRIAECALYCMGLNSSYPDVSVLYGSHRVYTLWNRQHIEDYFKHHRNAENHLFVIDPSVRALARALCDAFPEADLSDDDLLMTCSPDQTFLFHKLIREPLNWAAIKKNYCRIIELADEAIGQIAASRDVVSIDQIAQVYVLNVIGLLFFKQPHLGSLLFHSIRQFQSYWVKVAERTDTADDRKQLKSVIDAFRALIAKYDHQWSEPKKQALVFSLLLSEGAATTLVAAHFAHLSKQWHSRTVELSDASEDFFAQKTYSPKEFPKLFEDYHEEVLRNYPPAPAVVREAATDLMVGNTLIPKGSMVIARISAIRDRFYGENGPHTCVGKDLVKVMSLTFFMRFIELFEASFERPKNYHISLQLSGKIEPPVRFTCSKREDFRFPASKIYPD